MPPGARPVSSPVQGPASGPLPPLPQKPEQQQRQRNVPAGGAGDAAAPEPGAWQKGLGPLAMRHRRGLVLMLAALMSYALLVRLPGQADRAETQWSRSVAEQERIARQGRDQLPRRPDDIFKSKRSAKLWDPEELQRESLLRGSDKALCQHLMEPSTRSIAVVGNGPLRPEQRAQIQTYDKVVRFNALNNRVPGERMDLWIVRHNYRVPRPYWGFWQFNSSSDADRAVEEAGAVLFLGGDTRQSDYVIQRFPSLKGRSFQVDVFDYQLLYTSFFTASEDRNLNTPDPSTGLMGLLRILGCAGRHTEVHIFGFNWSAKHYFTHQMASEELIVRELAKGFKITVHATACAGLRSCEALCDGAEFQFSKEGEGADCRKLALERLAKKAAETGPPVERGADTDMFSGTDWATRSENGVPLSDAPG